MMRVTSTPPPPHLPPLCHPVETLIIIQTGHLFEGPVNLSICGFLLTIYFLPSLPLPPKYIVSKRMVPVSQLHRVTIHEKKLLSRHSKEIAAHQLEIISNLSIRVTLLG